MNELRTTYGVLFGTLLAACVGAPDGSERENAMVCDASPKVIERSNLAKSESGRQVRGFVETFDDEAPCDAGSLIDPSQAKLGNKVLIPGGWQFRASYSSNRQGYIAASRVQGGAGTQAARIELSNSAVFLSREIELPALTSTGGAQTSVFVDFRFASRRGGQMSSVPEGWIALGVRDLSQDDSDPLALDKGVQWTAVQAGTAIAPQGTITQLATGTLEAISGKPNKASDGLWLRLSPSQSISGIPHHFAVHVMVGSEQLSDEHASEEPQAVVDIDAIGIRVDSVESGEQMGWAPTVGPCGKTFAATFTCQDPAAYCKLADESCAPPGQSSPIEGPAGNCVTRPDISMLGGVGPLVMDPVYGCDGRIYQSSGQAATFGMNVWKKVGLRQPVCGANGQTYRNAGLLAAAGVAPMYEGECEQACFPWDECRWGSSNLRPSSDVIRFDQECVEYAPWGHDPNSHMGVCRLLPD